MTSHERRPGPGWSECPVPQAVRVAIRARSLSMWERKGVRVLSALEDAELPRGGAGPQWHVSISRIGALPRPADVERALSAFGLVGAEEDNHHPGNARHFWMPLDPRERVDCQCKETEEVVVTDGVAWTNPREGACRGCEIEPLTGRACPLHGERAA
jgi:hypothetical protein